MASTPTDEGTPIYFADLVTEDEYESSDFEQDSLDSDEPDFRAARSLLNEQLDEAEAARREFNRRFARPPQPGARPPLPSEQFDYSVDDYDAEYRLINSRIFDLGEQLEDLEERAEHHFWEQREIAQEMEAIVKRELADMGTDKNELPTASFCQADSPPTSLHEAWARKDYESVVELASCSIEQLASTPTRNDLDGVQQLCTALRYRFKAYKAMTLYSLAVADADRVMNLLSEFDVDVNFDDSQSPISTPATSGPAPSTTSAPDPDDKHSEIATSSSRPASGRRSARLTQQGQKRSASDSLTEEKAKRIKGKKPTKRRLVRRASEMLINFPVELILTIAELLDAVDRIRLASTRHDWRHIPQLWQALEFKRVCNTTSKGWGRDTVDAAVAAIETCQRRSHGTLSRVVLKGFVTSHAATQILEALRPSSATLKDLAIPAMDQKLCFEQLYQFCPNLEGIDIRIDMAPGYDVNIETLARYTSLFTLAKLPCKLKSFISRQSIDCGDIAPHLQGIEVVRGVSYKRQKQLNFIEGIVKAAPTLIEWQDDPDNKKWDRTTVTLGDYSVQQLPSSPIVFPKLRKLSGLWSEHFLDCEFPALIEARFNSLRGPSSLAPISPDNHARVATAISRSPFLKKLDVLLPSSQQPLKQIYQAISQLENVEELGLWSSGTLSLEMLVQAQRTGADNDVPGKGMLSALHTLRLAAMTNSGPRSLERELGEILLMRLYLSRGCAVKEAKSRTEAALIAYEKSGIGMTKSQKKKIVAGSADAAANSPYKGTFVMANGQKRETFTAVLPRLVLSQGMSKVLLEGSESLLNQLVFEIVEVDTKEEMSAFNQSRYHY